MEPTILMNSTRSRIVRLLFRHGPLHAADILAALDLTPTAVLNEIRNLSVAGIIRRCETGNSSQGQLYSVDKAEVSRCLLALLDTLGLHPSDRLTKPPG